MKKFLFNSLLFLLPFIAIAYPLDVFLSNQLKNDNSHSYFEYSVWNDLFTGRVNSDIVIYGSSRACVNIDPQVINDSLKQETYNLGVDGHNFWLQYLRHKTLLKYNKKPRIIILSVDIFTLQRRPDLYNSDQFLPYMVFNNQLKKNLNPYSYFSWYDYNIPLVRYYGERDALNVAVKNLIGLSNTGKGKIKGFKAINENWNNDFEVSQKKMKNYVIKYNKPTVELFNRFIKECNEDEIKIVMVYSPEHVLGQEFVTNREGLIKFYERISDIHDIPFLNYSDDLICANKDNFYNATHLNLVGTNLFMKKLGSDLKKIY